MSKTNTNELRPQDITTGVVSKGERNLQVWLAIAATALLMIPTMWFVFHNVTGEAQATVHHNIQMVKDLK